MQPFVAAAVLARRWEWLLIPMFLLTLSGFLIREPLIILARQRWARHEATPLSETAVRWLAAECVLLIAAVAVLIARLAWEPLCILVAAGALLTGISVWFSVKNWQRSVGLQLVAVPGLASSAIAAALAATGTLPAWCWVLWGLLAIHGIVAVLCVHARLEMRITAARPGRADDPRRAALYATIFQFLSAVPVAIYIAPILVLPILFSTAIHAIELWRLGKPEVVRERLQRVGVRMLGLSIAHSVLAIVALWPMASVR